MTSLRLRAELLLAPAEDSGWIHLPTTEYQVPLSFSVEELTTGLLAEVTTSSSVNIKPEQCLYLFLNGRIFGPQDASCTLQEIGAKDGVDVYLTSPYLSFEFGVQHTVLQLARPSKGKKFIVFPRLIDGIQVHGRRRGMAFQLSCRVVYEVPLQAEPVYRQSR